MRGGTDEVMERTGMCWNVEGGEDRPGRLWYILYVEGGVVEEDCSNI